MAWIFLNEGDVLHVFNDMDTDHNGSINSKEIKEYFKQILSKTLDDGDVNMMIKMGDLNDDRTMDFNEFKRIVQICNAPPDPDLASQLIDTFSRVDVDNNGSLDFDEFKQCLNYLEYANMSNAENLFRGRDGNEDGKINFTEFVALVLSLLEEVENSPDE